MEVSSEYFETATVPGHKYLMSDESIAWCIHCSRIFYFTYFKITNILFDFHEKPMKKITPNLLNI
jgi:hypothetical protein